MVDESKPKNEQEKKSDEKVGKKDGYPIIRFTHGFVVEKSCRISGFNVPDFYSDPENAKKDIQMIVEYHDVYNQFDRGVAKFEAEIVYLPDENGLYHPKIGELKKLDESLHKYKFAPSHHEIIMRYSIWKIIKAKIKAYFKKGKNLKTKRK